MSTTPAQQELRLRLEDCLLSIHDALVVVVAPRWEPGVFFKHVETCEAAVEGSGEGAGGTAVLRLSTGGGPVPWQVLRIAVPHDRLAEVEAFVAALEVGRRDSAAR